MASKEPTTEERRHWTAIVAIGCIVGPSTYCQGRLTVHHCGTGAGGRKDHRNVICLCWGHHQGPEGIDGQVLSKRGWQQKYGTEISLMVKTQDLLDVAQKKMP